MTTQPHANRSAEPPGSHWPKRLATLLCVATFPLIWIGGLITTTDAGMAVPDWPGTYGYNMFLYPWQSWVFGPWDLFIEHGHRLLASLVGLLAIALLCATLACHAPRWHVALAGAALVLVVFQGVLGGMRVLENDRSLAMAHGCTGPLFFALTCVLVAATHAKHRPKSVVGGSRGRTTGFGGPLGAAAGVAAVLSYAQLALGASLRHADAGLNPWTFARLVQGHLTMAGLVALAVLYVSWQACRPLSGANRARRRDQRSRSARFLGRLAGGLVAVQVALGVGAWFVKYGVPRWAESHLPATISAVAANGWTQTQTVSAHQAVGSLLLGVLAGAAASAWLAPAAFHPEGDLQRHRHRTAA